MTRRALVLVLATSVLGACGASAGSLCARLDECNALAAGVSATQCTENTQAALDALTPSARTDCLNQLGDALGNATCEAFLNEPLTSCTTFF